MRKKSSGAEAEAQGGRVTARVEGNLGYLVFENTSRRNAVSLDMLVNAETALTNWADDRDVRAVVVTGAGKDFVAGADISKFESARATSEDIDFYNRTNERIYSFLHNFPKPTIAMVRGYCIGGGLTMAMACDLRICSSTARFALPAAKLGLGYGYYSLKWFVEAIGPSFTKEIFFTARQFDATEALHMGLVNRCLPDTVLDRYVHDYASTIAANAPLTVSSVKAISREILKGSAADLDLCTDLFRQCWTSQDYVEGRRAFMAKRPPLFTGA